MGTIDCCRLRGCYPKSEKCSINSFQRSFRCNIHYLSMINTAWAISIQTVPFEKNHSVALSSSAPLRRRHQHHRHCHPHGHLVAVILHLFNFGFRLRTVLGFFLLFDGGNDSPRRPPSPDHVLVRDWKRRNVRRELHRDVGQRCYVQLFNPLVQDFIS